MKFDFDRGNKSIQIIVWNPFDAEQREHIGFGYGRWPTGRTLDHCRALGWDRFGFVGFVFGVFEIRYWPARQP